MHALIWLGGHEFGARHWLSKAGREANRDKAAGCVESEFVFCKCCAYAFYPVGVQCRATHKDQKVQCYWGGESACLYLFLCISVCLSPFDLSLSVSLHCEEALLSVCLVCIYLSLPALSSLASTSRGHWVRHLWDSRLSVFLSDCLDCLSLYLSVGAFTRPLSETFVRFSSLYISVCLSRLSLSVSFCRRLPSRRPPRASTESYARQEGVLPLCLSLSLSPFLFLSLSPFLSLSLSFSTFLSVSLLARFSLFFSLHFSVFPCISLCLSLSSCLSSLSFSHSISLCFSEFNPLYFNSISTLYACRYIFCIFCRGKSWT